MQVNFSFLPTATDSIFNSLSSTRLTPYLVKANGNKVIALMYYQWNITLCQSLYPTLQTTEIILRNSIASSLKSLYGETMFDSPKFLSLLPDKTKENIQEAKNRLLSQNKPLTLDNMIATLNFGFWTSLLGKKFGVHIWEKSFNHSFPYCNLPFESVKKRLADTEKKAIDINNLRNRISHHEPIFHTNIENTYDSMITIIQWICTDTKWWCENTNNFYEVRKNIPCGNAI